MDTPEFIKPIVNVIRMVFWFLVLAGIAWVVLAVLLILYPKLLDILFAVFFAFTGLVSIVVAVKVGKLLSIIKKVIKKI